MRIFDESTLILGPGRRSAKDIVNQIIDDRKSVALHLRPDMPAWSDVFARSRESDSPEAAGARVDALVKYLESLQEKAER